MQQQQQQRIEAVDIYFMRLANEYTLDYYYDVFKELSCLAWEAMQIRRTMEISNWPNCLNRVGWIGSPLLSSGT